MSENNLNINEQINIENNDGNLHFNNEFMLPPSNWVYLTPPMQKLKKPKLKGCSIQTAVMYRQNVTEREMYEIKPNIIVDVTKITTLNEIPYDPRFMRKITFDQNHESLQEYNTNLEPSRQTKFVSRYQMGLTMTESAKKQLLFNFDKDECLP